MMAMASPKRFRSSARRNASPNSPGSTLPIAMGGSYTASFLIADLCIAAAIAMMAPELRPNT